MLELLGATQLRSTWCGFPVPLKATVMVAFVDELLVTVNCPVAEPVVVGSNVNETLNVCPGFRVVGKLIAGVEKPLPVTEIEFTVTADVPLDVSVTVCVVELFTTTLPNETLLVFTLSADVAALSCSETDFEVLPVAAVSEADCAVLTEDTFAVNAAVDAVAGTVTEAGTLTAELSLESATLSPPEGAEPDRVTVQASASVPVIEVVPQLMPLTVGVTVVPVPLRLTVAVGALLEIVNCPVVEFAAVGSN